MTLFERVSDLAKKQGKSLNKVAEDTGLSKNALYSWRTSSPKAETLEAIAIYFHVSTDYLLGLTDDPSPKTSNQSSTDAKDIFKGAMSWNGEPLTEADKEAVLNFLAGRKSE